MESNFDHLSNYDFLLPRFWKKSDKETKESHEGVRALLKQKYKDLGPMLFNEIAVFILFVGLICLWFFRDPGFIKGWGNFVTIE